VNSVDRDQGGPLGPPLLDEFAAADLIAPTGVTLEQQFARRRLVFGALTIITICVLTIWLATLLLPAISLFPAVAMLTAFVIYAPMPVIWFWSALFGFAFFTWSKDPIGRVMPPARLAHASDPIVAATAIAITVRNGDPSLSFASLRALKSALDKTGFTDKFHYFVLSDTTHPDLIATEERAYEEWRSESSTPAQIFYRRRDRNLDFKSGNLHDFCARWGKSYELLIVLDADALMSADAVLRLVRVMQANPRLGILQTLPAGLPTESFFARVVQFGHYQLMRCFVLGSTWWSGDCCRPRGHNCAYRIGPFSKFCRMPAVLGGETTPKCCEDPIEAAFMYRAGYEVWFLPEEGGSYAGYPPTLLDVLQQKDRWCSGDMQNLKIVGLPDIAAMSRFHLLFVAQKHFASAAIVVFLLFAALVSLRPGNVFPAESALAFYVVLYILYFGPRLFGVADTVLRARKYGGLGRALAGGLTEMVLAFFLLPITTFAETVSLLAHAAGRRLRWEEYQRESRRVSWRAALGYFWPATTFGLTVLAWLAVKDSAAIVWFVPFLIGPILAAPLAVVTSSKTLGAWAARARLCALPDEIGNVPELAAVVPVFAGMRATNQIPWR